MSTNNKLTLTFRSGYGIKRGMGFSPEKRQNFKNPLFSQIMV
ncbi:MAG TPA: hypothetical protein PLQ91_02570 [Bacteroidales bacterium]|nr:hypothetical protein [Bacteroidales bacterium]HXK90776.1 hypothetical protein [Bacteroidales bacterium]